MAAKGLKRTLILCTAVSFISAASAFSETRPNVVLIVVDDLGWTGLTCYGSDLHQTPVIDGLAASGLRFTDAYAAAPVCSPTRAAIMTGKSPAALHMTVWREAAGEPPAWMRRKLIPPVTRRDLPQREVTLAEALKAAGYLTFHVGKWHLGGAANYPEAHGFDVNIGGTLWGCPVTYFYPFRGRFGSEGEFRYVPGLGLGEKGQYLTDRLTDEAVKLIKAAGNRPFFLNLWFYTVHTPIEGKPELVARYKRKIEEAERAGRKLWHDNAHYAAMHETLDSNVGRILATLRSQGIDRRTIVILTSDNGGYVNEWGGRRVTRNAPLRSGKGSLYEGGLRVPLIVRWPGVTKPGGVCRVPVISMDLYPTICEMAGVKPSAGRLEGRSLVRLLRDPESKWAPRPLYFHYPHYYPTTTPVSAIRTGDWKLLYYYEDGRLELYDLKSDIGEKHNLKDSMPEKAAQLKKLLRRCLQEADAQSPRIPGSLKVRSL